MIREYSDATFISESHACVSTGRESAGATSLVDIGPGVHPAIVSRWMGSSSSSAVGPLLQLQRQAGNRYVRRIVEVSRIQRDDGDDSPQNPWKPPSLVGADRTVDPNDKGFSVKSNLDPFSPAPSGVEADPGMLGIPGHGDPFKYPSDQPSATPGPDPFQGLVRPTGCPPDQWVPLARITARSAIASSPRSRPRCRCPHHRRLPSRVITTCRSRIRMSRWLSKSRT